MNDAELLTGLFNAKIKKRKGKKVDIRDDISDITFMLHWYSQFTVESLLEMNLRTFDALLRHGKADYLYMHLQEIVGKASVSSNQAGTAEKYIKQVEDEIKRLRE